MSPRLGLSGLDCITGDDDGEFFASDATDVASKKREKTEIN